MKLLWFILLIAIVGQAASRRRYSGNSKARSRRNVRFNRKSRDVGTLCNRHNCGRGEVCRVAKDSCSDLGRFKRRCFPCVNEGTDDVCHANGYLKAVLYNRNKNEGEPYFCTMKEDDRHNCPAGSKCVETEENPGIGVCCYGDKQVDTEVDRTCKPCIDGCPKGESCQAEVKCGRLQHSCQVYRKPGCPVFRMDFCNMYEMFPKCVEDKDCHEGHICCHTYQCGIDICVNST